MDTHQDRSPAQCTAGWTGRYWEDFVTGEMYRHQLGRTVHETDNSWFTLLTQNTAAIHFDKHLASQSEWGRPLMNSTLTLALVTGQSVSDVSMNVMANLGWDRVRLPNPVFEGDTIYSQSEVISTRVSVSRPEVGIVVVRTVGYTQEGVVVITFERTMLIYKRGCGPERTNMGPIWDEKSREAAGLLGDGN